MVFSITSESLTDDSEGTSCLTSFEKTCEIPRFIDKFQTGRPNQTF